MRHGPTREEHAAIASTIIAAVMAGMNPKMDAGAIVAKARDVANGLGAELGLETEDERRARYDDEDKSRRAHLDNPEVGHGA